MFDPIRLVRGEHNIRDIGIVPVSRCQNTVISSFHQSCGLQVVCQGPFGVSHLVHDHRMDPKSSPTAFIVSRLTMAGTLAHSVNASLAPAIARSLFAHGNDQQQTRRLYLPTGIPLMGLERKNLLTNPDEP